MWTYAEVMSGQPLLFNVESIYDMRPQLVEQSIAIIKGSVVTCPFTGVVLTVLQAITNSISRLEQVCASLGVIENYASQYMVVVGWVCEA